MHAMLVTVDIDGTRVDESTKVLHEVTIPMVKSRPGFLRGSWLRSADGTSGRGVIMFDTADNANTAVSTLRDQGPPAGGPVKIKSVDVFEVIAEA